MEAKPCTSSTKQVNNVHTCNIPDIQKDAEFIMEPLNDPNFDLSQLLLSIPVVEGETTKRYVGKDGNGAISINEWALLLSFPPFSPFQQNTIASSHILKCELLYPILMIPWCQSTPFACGSWEFSSPFWFLVWTRFDLQCMFVIISPFLWYHMIYVFPDPSIYVSSVVVQIASLPLGHGLAAILSSKQFKTFGYIWSLNPGPFVLAVKAPIQSMSSSHNISSMVKPHPWVPCPWVSNPWLMS